MANSTKYIVASCEVDEPYSNPCAFKVNLPSLKCPDPGIEVKILWTFLKHFGIPVIFNRMSYAEKLRSLANGSSDIACTTNNLEGDMSFGVRCFNFLFEQTN